MVMLVMMWITDGCCVEADGGGCGGGGGRWVVLMVIGNTYDVDNGCYLKEEKKTEKTTPFEG